MTTILETPRLRLREFRADDLDTLAAMVADEDQMRFYPATRTREEAHAWLDRNRAFYERHGYGFWLVEARDSEAFLGYCGIRPLVLAGAAKTEIGWHTRKTAWNNGVATEAAAAVRDAAFERFGRDELVALIRPGHDASSRVAEKIGMRIRGSAVVDGDRYLTYVCVSPDP